MALPTNLGLSSVLRLNDSANGTTLRSIMTLPTIYRIKENPDGSTNFNTPATVFSAFADPIQSDSNIVVNTLVDNDNGICDAADCSLREAINYANSDGVNSAITFGVSGTIRLTSALPALVNNGTLSITGSQAGITISGDANNSGANDVGDVPIFSVIAGANVTLNNLTLTGGRASGQTPESTLGGAINNEGTLKVSNCKLTNNFALNFGGAINNFGAVTVTGSTLDNNSTRFMGGAINNEGGTLTVIGSTLTNNSTAHSGGAIRNLEGGTATVVNSTLVRNSAEYSEFGVPQAMGEGGAIYNEGMLTVSSSTLVDNYGGRNGGSIYNLQSDTLPGSATIKNNIFVARQGDTFYGLPTNPSNSGDANKNYWFGSQGSVGLVALADNGGPTQTMALIEGSPVIDKGDATDAPQYDQRGEARVQGASIDVGTFEVQNNAPTDLALSNATMPDNTTSGTTVGTFSTTDQPSDSHTYSLVSGAGDSDNASFVIEGNALKTAATFDFETRSSYSIRVQTRDSGELTFQKAFAINVGNVNEELPSLVVTTLADGVAEDGVTSLREAINYANSDGVNSAITFGVSGTIRLTSALPALVNNGTLSITGPQAGITISGDANNYNSNSGVNDALDVPIFSMNAGANVTLDKLDLRGGRSTEYGSGAAINNFGTLKVSNCTLANNSARRSGAILNNGTLTVTGSTLKYNSAYNGGAIRSNIAATIINCTLTGNYAVEVGGAIFLRYTMTMINSTLADNLAEYNAGAIYTEGGALTWKNNLFAQNNGAFSGLTNPTSSGDANKNYSFDSLGAAGLSYSPNNGGPTQTMALSPTSPVVDKGLDTTDSLSTDQRGTGYARKGGSAVDIGAFEVQTQGSTTATAINSQPQNQSVCETAPANFSVGATGTTLTYQWRKGGVNLIDGGTISGATSANLIISSAATSSAGSYDVVVTGAQGTATSNAAALTVNSAPAITNQPTDQNVNSGASASFTAAASGAQTVQWQVSTNGGTSFSDISGATAATLTLSAVTSTQNGSKYRAVFSGACGNPATSGAATLTVGKLAQTITFGVIANKTYGDAPFALTASSTSNLPVSFSIVSGAATISNNNMLTINGAGAVTVRAAQAGDNQYNAAPSADRSFTVNKATPVVTWSNPADIAYGTRLGATQLNAATTIAGSFVYNPAAGALLDAGANQNLLATFTPDDANNYDAATQNVKINVSKASQTITFANPGTKTFGSAPFNLGGTTSSGLIVSYAVVSGPATVSGRSTLTINGTGIVTVKASQSGNANYNAASDVTQTFTVNKAALLITAENKSGVYSDALPLLTYTISGFIGGDTASIVSGAPALNTAANITGGKIMSGAGTYPITAAPGSLSATNYSFNFASGTLNVSRETTQTDYTGDNYVITAGANVGTASAVRLAAHLTQEADIAPGDIALAKARIELYKFSNTSTTPNYVFGNLAVNASGDVETTVSLAVDDAYTVRVIIESANAFWTAQPVYEGTLTVAYGSTEKRVTGGGWVADTNSANGKGNFGFTVNYGNNGSPKGNALYTFRGADGFNYRVKSNSWQGGGLTFYQDAAKAAFSGKCNVQKIDSATGAVVQSWGGYTFNVDLVDGDLRNPRETDRYAIQILSDAGTVWRQIGSRTSPVHLGGGNVSVKNK